MGEIRRLFGRFRLQVGVGCTLGGLLAIAGGYVGVSGTSVTTDQLSYLTSGGLGGVALVIIGTGLLVVDYFARLERAIEAAVRGREAIPGVLPGPILGVTDGNRDKPLTKVVVVKGAGRFHVGGCSTLARHHEATTMSLDEALGGGLAPCRLCVDLARLPVELELR